MLKVVLDTNILFSALLSKKGQIRKIIVDESCVFFSCNFAIAELISHSNKLIRNLKIKQEEWQLFAYQVIKNVNFVNESFLSSKSLNTAVKLCNDVDIKDTPFVALSLELDGYLWTGDKLLANGLKRKHFDKVLMTDDLVKLIGKRIYEEIN
jgi:predicted nucleic acid-binding protein